MILGTQHGLYTTCVFILFFILTLRLHRPAFVQIKKGSTKGVMKRLDKTIAITQKKTRNDNKVRIYLETDNTISRVGEK